MFTGLITDIGEIADIDTGQPDRRLSVRCRYDPATIAAGASIACAGICLTVTEISKHESGCCFSVDASEETVATTTLGDWRPGRKLNLERALAVGDELGGHIVTGHVDGAAEIIGRQTRGGSIVLTLQAPDALARLVAVKGSVALDGVSLTVNGVTGREFGINIIPHTSQKTTLAELQAGDSVNMEIDVMARYAARLRDWDKEHG